MEYDATRWTTNDSEEGNICIQKCDYYKFLKKKALQGSKK